MVIHLGFVLHDLYRQIGYKNEARAGLTSKGAIACGLDGHLFSRFELCFGAR